MPRFYAYYTIGFEPARFDLLFHYVSGHDFSQLAAATAQRNFFLLKPFLTSHRSIWRTQRVKVAAE